MFLGVLMDESYDGDELDEVRRIRQIAMMKRETRRLRNSVSFRLGLHLTNAVRKPWKLLILPLSFPILCLQLGLERLGRKASPKSGHHDERDIEPRKNSIVLFPTNGVGFGHFTRMYAIARELIKKDPEIEIIFFTTMPTLHIPYVENFATYHLAGRHKYKDMSSSTWNMIVEEMLTLVLEIHNPKWFMYDGAFPYRGMLNAIYGRDEINRIWMRRGMFRKGSSIPIDSIEHFDLIIHPDDAYPIEKSEVEYDVKTLRIPPITLLQYPEILSRDDSRGRLNLPLDSRVVYVQLGAGQINDIESEIRWVLDTLLSFDDVHVVLGESMLGERMNITMKRLHVLRDYPNSLFFNAFDFSVQAGGYNSFHEMRNIGMPTLFFPNMETGMDDQLARCNVAVEEGWGIVLEKRTSEEIKTTIPKLFSLQRSNPLDSDSGSVKVAEFIIQDM